MGEIWLNIEISSWTSGSSLHASLMKRKINEQQDIISLSSRTIGFPTNHKCWLSWAGLLPYQNFCQSDPPAWTVAKLTHKKKSRGIFRALFTVLAPSISWQPKRHWRISFLSRQTMSKLCVLDVNSHWRASSFVHFRACFTLIALLA